MAPTITWLKTSILGTILLGAISSILAVGILRLLARLPARYRSPLLRKLVSYLYIPYRSPHSVLEHLRASSDPRTVVVTCVVLLAQFCFFSLLLCSGFILVTLLAAIIKHPSGPFQYACLFFSTFVGVSGAINASRILTLLEAIYKLYMEDPQTGAVARPKKEIHS